MSRHNLQAELLRFAATGGTAYFADVTMFNVLILWGGVASVPAKILSSALAIAVAFAGSRWFTWADRRTSTHPGHQALLFLLLSVLAAGLQLACLLVSHHLLGLRSAVADNVSANLVGMAAATAFRFWSFRTFVFSRAAAWPPAKPSAVASVDGRSHVA